MGNMVRLFKYELNNTQMRIIQYISKNEFTNRTDIRKSLDLTYDTVRKYCEILEVYGFLDTTTSKNDGRSSTINISNLGKRSLGHIKNILDGKSAISNLIRKRGAR